MLREELLLLGEPGIKVCTVLPTGVDTPFFRHAANHTGRSLRSLPPMATPERIARAVVRTARRPRRRRLVGPYARLLAVAQAAAPVLVRRTVGRRADRAYFGAGTEGEATSGILDEPSGTSAAVHGGRRAGWRTFARRAVAAALLGAVGAGRVLRSARLREGFRAG
ncbi:hypothetical protein [Streptomyces sp. NPDC056387]|uniref:hypothetical protein n=1 Tax=Streptomyces sp. NPDC056387 TaxID=3345803 RepID=UPI0035D66797